MKDDVIRLRPDVCSALIEHVYAALPAEAVGLMGGPEPGYATRIFPLPNRGGRYTFLADAYAQFRAERQLAQLGLRLLAVYHSHPGGSANLSSLDIVFARQRECLQFVIALKGLHTLDHEMRAYRLGDASIVEVRILIETSHSHLTATANAPNPPITAGG